MIQRKKRHIECEGQGIYLDETYQPLKLMSQKINEGKLWIKATDTKSNSKVVIEYLKHVNGGNAIQTIARELTLLKDLELHENILFPIDVIYDIKEKEQNGVEISIVYPLMDASLQSIRKDLIQLCHVQYALYLLLRGLQYIHSAGIVHCDVRPANILLDSNDNQKIRNFKSAQKQGEIIYGNSLSNCSSPELLMDSSFITTAADIWSAGCVLAELITQKPILQFNDQTEGLIQMIQLLGVPSMKDLDDSFIGTLENKQVLKDLICSQTEKVGTINKRLEQLNIDPQCKDLILKMLQFNPKKRLSAEECMKHPFFNELHEDDQVIKFKGQIEFSKYEVGFQSQKEFLTSQSNKYFQLRQAKN